MSLSTLFRRPLNSAQDVSQCPTAAAMYTIPKGSILRQSSNSRKSSAGGSRDYVQHHPSAKYVEGCEGIWSIPCQIALPCATQNELNYEAAQTLVKNGVVAIAEGANMPCTPEAADLLIKAGVLFGPGKAANAGGVATSGLEMQQNDMRTSWLFDEVDTRLKDIMKSIYTESSSAAEEYGCPGNLVVGAKHSGIRQGCQRYDRSRRHLGPM